MNQEAEHIKRILGYITPGKWEWGTGINGAYIKVGEGFEQQVAICPENGQITRTKSRLNAEFIANAPELVSSLITTIESQKEEIEKLRSQLDAKLTFVNTGSEDLRWAIQERQDAITELAVKTLEYYANKNNYGTENLSTHGFIPIDDDGGLMARTTLEVIMQRLSHIQAGKWFCIACSKMIPPEHIDVHRYGGCSPELRMDKHEPR